MRKQTKLVAVLSAAALLAMGASMTSFAAGWQKDDAGVWHYYDSDDNQVTDEWKKDGGKWFYLNEDGDMETDAWVDDEYYVGGDGAMLVNQWIKTTTDADQADPDDDGEHWYYFNNKGKKVTDDKKKINGKTYYFNSDGEMRYGWYAANANDWYYLGGEDEGWRTDAQWLWLDEPNEDDEDNDSMPSHTDSCSLCDSEGWYYFQNDGKLYRDNTKKKKINGKYYYFNEDGQMLYEWINTKESTATPGFVLDDQRDSNNNKINATATAGDMIYANEVEDGSRAAGWYEIDGASDLDSENDTDWYFFKKGEAKKASRDAADAQETSKPGEIVYRKKIKVNGKYFCFDEQGKMQTGLQRIGNNTYYFDDNGYMKTGKVTADDSNDDTFTFYFSTKNNDTGKGQNGIKDGYLYLDGQRLEADDDYAVYEYNSKYYVVNKTGKVQKSTSKKYELDGSEGFVKVKNDGTVNEYYADDNKGTTATALPGTVVREGGFNGEDGVVWEP